MNDRYGIQTRGGCSCAGTYGHYLLDVDFDFSHTITDNINSGDLTLKPGWVRMSLHPTMTNEEVNFIINAIEELAKNHKNWTSDYEYNPDLIAGLTIQIGSTMIDTSIKSKLKKLEKIMVEA